LEKEAENNTYFNELDVRKPMVVSVRQRSEDLGLHNPVYILTITEPSLKATSSYASLGSSVCVLVGDDRGFLRDGDGPKTYQMTPMPHLNSTIFFSVFTAVV
jgi:hypothetical protein